MKKFKRLIAFVIMLTLCAGIAVVAPLSAYSSVYAFSPSIGTVMTIKGFNSTGKMGEVLTIPKATTASGSVTMEIRDPRGNLITDFVSENANSVVIRPTSIGYYTVKYIASDNITKSQTYSILVTGTKPVIEFENNSKVFLPDKIYDAKEVELPVPTVTEANGTVVENISLIRNTDSGTGNYVTVSVKDPNGANVELTVKDGKIYFNAVKNSENKYIYGKYTITYYYQSSTGLSATKYVTVEVERDYKENVVDKIDMTFVFESGKSFPTSGTLGQELVLPRPVAQDKNQSNAEIKAYVEVKVDFIPEGNLSNEKISYNGSLSRDFNNNTFSFIPMHKTSNNGYYRVEYTITDYFGHKIESLVYEIRNVTDTVKPVIYLVNDYNVKTDDGVKTIDGDVDLVNDLTYMIPSKIVISTNQDLVLPAIYATDNFASYGDMTLQRIWIDGTTQTRIDTDETVNKAVTLSLSNSDLNANIKKSLQTAGTYKIRYQAYDGVNTNRSVEFEVVVVDANFVDSTAPRITMPTITKTAKTGETISFKLPTVTDYASTSLQEANVDTKNCKVEVGYYYGNNYNSFVNDFKAGKALSECTDGSNFTILHLSSDNKTLYTFEAPAYQAGYELRIVVRAIDNAKFGSPNGGEGEPSKNNVAVKDASIRLVNVDTATVVPPTFDMSQIKSNIDAIGQNETVYIESDLANKDFIFRGVDSDFTEITVNVYDPSGKDVTVRGTSTTVLTVNTDQISLNAGYFRTTKDGQYIVTFTAKDIANNIVIIAYTLTVNDTIPPVIEVDDFKSTVTVGEAIYLPDCIMIDNGEVKENQADVSIDFKGFDNPKYSFISASNKFTALEAGTFTFKYVVSDGVNEPVEAIKTITAVAKSQSSEESLTLDETDWAPTAALVPVLDSDNNETGRYNLINLPYLQPKNVEKGIKSYKVTVKSQDGNDINVTETPADVRVYGTFEPTAKDGVYTVTYSIMDLAGNEYTLEKKLNVGDVTPPELKIANQEVNLPSSAKLNGKLTIAYSDFDFSDEVSDKSDMTFVVTITKANGTTETLTRTDGYYNYTFTEAGTYKLTYKLTDKAGNVTTKVQEIEVSAEGVTETVVTSIITGVLIGLFVALCAGIVIYFIVANKKAKTVKKDTPTRVQK